MTETLQSAGIIALSILGALAGVWFARRRSALWLAGFCLPLLIVLMIGLPRRHYPLAFVPPFSWLVAGRIEFALVGPLAAMMMATPIARLPRGRVRWAAGVFVAAFVVQSSVMPFLMPALQHDAMAALRTNVRADGVCRQSTDYTCGPAAAVTALRALGLSAQESELALAAHTSRATGTEPDVLADALTTRHAADGLTAEYRPFANCRDLPRDRPVIALINYKFLVDHYVAVLEVDDTTVTVGDPLSGKTQMTHAEFEQNWRRVGIVLTRGKGG